MSAMASVLRRVHVATEPAYDVVVGDGLLDRAADFVAESHVAVISDDNVAPLYAGRLADSLTAVGKSVTVLSVAPGEASKQLSTMGRLLEAMATVGLGRNAAVLALGGGVVGDL